MATRPRKRTAKDRRIVKEKNAGDDRRFRVYASLQVFNISKRGSALSIDIYERGEKFGTLQIGRGSLNWTPRSGRKSRPVSWERFAALMEALR